MEIRSGMEGTSTDRWRSVREKAQLTKDMIVIEVVVAHVRPSPQQINRVTIRQAAVSKGSLIYTIPPLHVGIKPMLRPVELPGPLRLPPALFDVKNDPLWALPLLVRVLDPFFFLPPLAPDLSLHFLAPLKPPRRPPRPLWEPPELRR